MITQSQPPFTDGRAAFSSALSRCLSALKWALVTPLIVVFWCLFNVWSQVRVPKPWSDSSILKQSEALERRASKRFSTYNISKMTGGSMRVHMSPHGPGHNNRKSMAVSSALTPGDLAVLTEENEEEVTPRRRDRSKGSMRSQRSRGPSPIIEEESEAPAPPPVPPSPSKQPSPITASPVSEHKELPPPPSVLAARVETPDSPTGPFPVFLQLGREVKKVTIEPGLSYSSLRVLFVDKFSYNPGQDNFPAIYIRDPSSGVQYELEDMDEIKEKCLLSLNIEREYSASRRRRWF